MMLPSAPEEVSEYDRQKIYTGWLEAHECALCGCFVFSKSKRCWLTWNVKIHGKLGILRLFTLEILKIQASFLPLHRKRKTTFASLQLMSSLSHVSPAKHLRHPSAHERKLLFARGNLHGFPRRTRDVFLERDVFKLFRAQKSPKRDIDHHFQGKMLEGSLILRPSQYGIMYLCKL